MVLNPKDLLDVADKLGLIEAVRNKIVGNPDVAAEKILIAVEELSQGLAVFETELVRFFALSFDNDEEIARAREILLGLEGSELLIRIERGKAAVARVRNVYDRYLYSWVKSITNQLELEMLRDLVGDMSGDEEDYLDLLTELAEELREAAAEVLALVNGSRFAEASAKVMEVRQETLPRRAVATSLARKLFLLQAELIASTGAT